MSIKQKVLVPVDFSVKALDAVRSARDLALETTEVTLIHVFDPAPITSPGTLDLTPGAKELPADVERRVMKSLEQIRDRELPSMKKVNLELAVSRFPAKAICQYAERQLIDLIILTTHGRTGLSHMLLGSVAEEVIRKAPCPVLVMRPVKYGAAREEQKEADPSKTSEKNK
jgi:universal stress protein A